MALEPVKLSDFTLAGALGSGATAKVYAATHLATGRAVAIKVMSEVGQSPEMRERFGPEMRERFTREALLLAGVDSRHVAKILGFGFDEGQPFLVLERLRGETLDARLRRDGPAQLALAAHWIEQLIVGVRDCHDAKVIHRDIKPSNVFLHHDGVEETVKLIDFGVARLREIAGDDGGGLTSTSHVLGSMGYMAPEQFESAKSVGFPADLYAVGVVIFRMFTGRLPFVSRSLEAVLRMKTEQVVPWISTMPGAIQNPRLDAFVQKAMVQDPAGRFQNAREMLEQWWSVMASIEGDNADATDKLPALVNVDESSAEAREAPARLTPPRPSPTSVGKIAPPRPSGEDEPPTLRVPLRRDGSGAGDARRADADDDAEADPFDLPTRTDPNLRQLVERERELHRARRRDRG